MLELLVDRIDHVFGKSPRGFLPVIERCVVIRLVPYLRVDGEGGIETLAAQRGGDICQF
jgi:hypothetical protein